LGPGGGSDDEVSALVTVSASLRWCTGKRLDIKMGATGNTRSCRSEGGYDRPIMPL